jgi:RNA-directed DNA polymerase
MTLVSQSLSAGAAAAELWRWADCGGSAEAVFDADIKSCFDRISHSWLIEHVPMDKEILRKWLAAG